MVLPQHARAISICLFVTKPYGGKKVHTAAQGFSRRPSIDYTDTFAQVYRYASYWSFVALGTQNAIATRQFDVIT